MGQYWPGMYKGQGPKRNITGDIQIFLKKTKEKKSVLVWSGHTGYRTEAHKCIQASRFGELREALTLMYCRSVSARTLKSETYWPRMQLPNWLLPAREEGVMSVLRSG